MTKWNIRVSSSVIIEAETPDEAKRELQAAIERKDMDCGQDWLDVASDLLLNAQVESIEAEPKWSEHDNE